MTKDRKVSCPICGGQLLFCVKADSSLKRKINKDGRLSKVVHEGYRHLTGEYRIGDNWYPCIPLSDECVAPFQDCYISVITRNGAWNHLKKDEFRMII